MKYSFLTGILLICCLTKVAAQGGVYLQNVDGRPVFEKKYVDVQGSPYLEEDWAQGAVDLKNGKSFKEVALKYDLVADEVLFKNEKGEAYAFAQPVKAFSLIRPGDKSQRIFRNGYAPVKGGTESSYYEVLADGKVQLLQRKVKKIREDKAYGSATAVRTMEEYTNYFIAKDGVPVNIKKSEKAVLEAIGGDSTALEAYIRSNKLNLKNDGDLVKLLTYYNGLAAGGK
jgi:hypothetical protein